MTDNARAVALNPDAPADERRDALAELQKSAMPQVRDQFIAAERLKPIIDWMRASAEQEEMSKALRANNVIPFPSHAARNREPGMQSVYLDDVQIGVMGDYYERPGAFNFEAMRMMVDQTPVLSSVVFQRIRQIQRFCRPQVGGKGPGFKIAPVDKEDKGAAAAKADNIKVIESFFRNCGHEKNARARRRLRRDDFQTFVAKLVRDTLTMDSMPIETEWKRDRKLGIDGLYAVDGATIRLCTEQGYRGDDEIFAIQLVQGNIRSAYTYDDLIYVPRNPRTDVLSGGYGLSETELLIKVVTGFLNAFTYNVKFFDSNAMPKGILNLFGNYSEEDTNAFKRYWNSMVKGINNAWSLPVMISKDAESKAQFEAFGNEVNELMFGKWMTLLTSIICAIFGMSPEEINFESFTNGTSSLSGDDTEEKLVNSKDKGLRPLLAYLANVFTEYVVNDFDEELEFQWTGLDEENAKDALERKKLMLRVNELRAEDGREPITEQWGEAPLNPALMSAWQLDHQPPQDFGQPGEGGPPGGGEDGGGEDEDFGSPGPENDSGGEFGDAGGEDAPPAGGDQDGASITDLGKAFGLPVLRIEP